MPGRGSATTGGRARCMRWRAPSSRATAAGCREDAGRAARAAWGRRLYRGRAAGDRLRSAGRAGRRQRAARDGAHRRRRDAAAGGHGRAAAAGGGAAPDAARGRRRPGADGSRRHRCAGRARRAACSARGGRPAPAMPRASPRSCRGGRRARRARCGGGSRSCWRGRMARSCSAAGRPAGLLGRPARAAVEPVARGRARARGGARPCPGERRPGGCTRRPVRHVFTPLRARADACRGDARPRRRTASGARRSELDRLALPSVMRKLLRAGLPCRRRGALNQEVAFLRRAVEAPGAVIALAAAASLGGKLSDGS